MNMNIYSILNWSNSSYCRLTKPNSPMDSPGFVSLRSNVIMNVTISRCSPSWWSLASHIILGAHWWEFPRYIHHYWGRCIPITKIKHCLSMIGTPLLAKTFFMLRWEFGLLFTKQKDFLPQDLIKKSRSCEIRIKTFQSLCNLTGTLATLLPRCLLHFTVI